MEVKKTVYWKLKSGKAVHAEIVALRSATTGEHDLDGHIFQGKRETIESVKINVTVGGKCFSYGAYHIGTVREGLSSKLSWDADMAKRVQALGGYGWIGQIIVSEDVYTQVQTAIADATAEAEQDPEWRAVKGLSSDSESNSESKQAASAECKSVVIPQEAVAAYHQYHSSEKAWAAEDEQAWALIKKHESALEAQFGADPQELREELQTAMAESGYGIQD